MAVDKLVDSNRLNADLTSVANAIRTKGSTSDPLAFPNGFISAINAIPTGGSESVERKDINFIDYDGTIVKSYTAAEFADLEALPDNPEHDGLTAQGWNWTLADAKAYVAKYGKLFIGQMYITDDGKTRIYIRLEQGRLAPYLGIAINGSAVIDWGDNSTPDTITGSSDSRIINTQHTYATAGDYVISIAVTGSMSLIGSVNGSRLLYKNKTNNEDVVYRNAIKKVEIGTNTSIGNYAFYECKTLASVTIPYGMTSIGNYAFANCTAFASVTIPDGMTSTGDNTFNLCSALVLVAIPDGITRIGNNAFSSCYSLASVTIPDSMPIIRNNAFSSCYSLASVTIPDGVTSITSGAFINCFGMGEIHFLSTTPPTVLQSDAFTNIPTDCKIYVPTGSLDAYTTAANYPSSSTYTYVEE